MENDVKKLMGAVRKMESGLKSTGKKANKITASIENIAANVEVLAANFAILADVILKLAVEVEGLKNWKASILN